MPNKPSALLVALLVFVVWSVAANLADADGPAEQILLAVTDGASVGKSTEVVATVTGSDGVPLGGVEVTFAAELEFMNTFGAAVIGRVETDLEGVARLSYVPRTAGEIGVVARVEHPEGGDTVEAVATLLVAPGSHLFHPEDAAHILRGRWDWFVQWTWLVIMPAAAFAAFLGVLGLLWAIGREGSHPEEPRPGVISRNALVPLGGTVAVLALAVVLILGIALRPWASIDTGWRTELNLLHQVPDDYTRSIPTLVGEAPILESWRPREAASSLDGDHASRLYVGYACASCHGLSGEGGVVGPAFEDLSASDIRKALKKGEGGMPDYSGLGDLDSDALLAVLTDFQAIAIAAAAPDDEPVPVAAPTPVPTSPPLVTVAPTAVPTAVPTPTPAPASPEEGFPTSALYLINSSGLHALSALLKSAGSIEEIGVHAEDRVRGVLELSRASTFPEVLSGEVASFEGAASDLLDALAAGDLAAAAIVGEAAHGAQHALYHASYQWLAEHRDGPEDPLLAAVSVVAALDVIDGTDLHGFHLRLESAQSLDGQDLIGRDELLAALTASRAAPFPDLLAESVAAFQTDIQALVDALDSSDLEAAKMASAGAHGSQHVLSHRAYGWLAEQQGDAIVGALAAFGATPEATPAATPGPTETAPASPTPEGPGGPVSLTAVSASITVDGDTSDWGAIPVTEVVLQQIRPIPGVEMGQVGPIEVGLRVAVDGERVYVLMEVLDDYDYDPEDHGLSAAMAVMFRIDDPAAPHMGTTEENQKRSLGKVDIWHWELDCGPGEMSGGGAGIRGGNDPRCNLDDEWAETPSDLEDDGTRSAENSLAGVWEHTARAEGNGAEGTWIFEMSRKLQTGDVDDAQIVAGMTAAAALAYWDADETPDGWTSEGHLQSSSGGWIEITFP